MDLQALNDQATQAGQQAVNYQSAADLLPQKLKEAIQGKLDYNRDIITEQNKAQANYFAAPATARDQYQGIWNPFEREKLVAQATSNAYAPYATLTDILGQRQGHIQDLIGAGVGAFNSGVTAQQGKAKIADDAFSRALALYNATHKGGGEGSPDLLSLLAGLQGGQQQGEQQPLYSPNIKDTSQPTFSPGGQWYFDIPTGEWLQVTD